MKIVLYGVETVNKGAELMLYAILQEIERVHPDTVIYMPESRMPQGKDYVKTSLKIRYWPLEGIINKLHLLGIFRHLHLPSGWLVNPFVFKGTDFFLDGSGFRFSDQFVEIGERSGWWKRVLQVLSKERAKIVFLPQAFGPVKFKNTIDTLFALSKYSSIIMAREDVSYNYLRESGVVDMKKVKLYPDFTSLVKGEFPKKYIHLRDGICVIPNIRMISSGTISYDDYIALITSVIQEGKKCGRTVYLLNHEGTDDEQLALKCRKSTNYQIEVVTGLNALEVKGLLASAYLVISSRYHGVVSSLNSGVPCLATSWSHKYGELFKDYGLDDCLLPLTNNNIAAEKISFFANRDNNDMIRKHLKKSVSVLQEKTRKMWEDIWNL